MSSLPSYALVPKEGPAIYAAVCLAGEAGLRVGEVKALRLREDVDLVAQTVTVNQQMRRGVVGTPKGRTRRTVPMTPTLTKRCARCQSCARATGCSTTLSWRARPREARGERREAVDGAALQGPHSGSSALAPAAAQLPERTRRLAL